MRGPQLPRTPLRVTSLPLPLQVPTCKIRHAPRTTTSHQLACNLHAGHGRGIALSTVNAAASSCTHHTTCIAGARHAAHPRGLCGRGHRPPAPQRPEQRGGLPLLPWTHACRLPRAGNDASAGTLALQLLLPHISKALALPHISKALSP